MGCGAMPTRQGGNRYWTGCRITLFIAASLLSIIAYIGALVVATAGERQVIILVGLVTLALLFVTSIAQRGPNS